MVVIDLDRTVAFVTGANRGLGRAFAVALLEAGATVYAGARDPDTVDIEGVRPIRLDVTDAATIHSAVRLMPDLTMVVNNAGVHDQASVFDADVVDRTERVLNVNLLGVLAMSQATAPVLVANGNAAIVNVLSAGSWLHGAGMLPYTVSKAAALSLTHTIRAELNPLGVQVTAVHAGFIDTDMMSAFTGPKLEPLGVTRMCITAVRRGEQEVLLDDMSRKAKATAVAPISPFVPQLPS